VTSPAWGRLAVPQSRQKHARIVTPRGDLVVELNPQVAPRTVAHFEELVRSGFYDGLAFFRVRPEVAQAGCPNNNGAARGTALIEYEPTGLSHQAGAVALVRGQAETTVGSQFMICLRDLPSLNGHHSVFGRVVDGMDVAASLQVGDIMTEVVLVGWE
jgi:peptidyl-prolyl cis-trans isomerase B (cyclophilin B)